MTDIQAYKAVLHAKIACGVLDCPPGWTKSNTLTGVYYFMVDIGSAGKPRIYNFLTEKDFILHKDLWFVKVPSTPDYEYQSIFLSSRSLNSAIAIHCILIANSLLDKSYYL